MRVLLKLRLHCDPDVAWRFIRSPAGLTSASRPFMAFESLEDDGYPEVWLAGEHPVAVKAFGIIPLGHQLIRISYPRPRQGARLVRDTGEGISGVFILVRRWEHTMSVSALPQGKTLFRDQLVFDAGLISPLLWVSYWLFWQWRGLVIWRLTRRH